MTKCLVSKPKRERHIDVSTIRNEKSDSWKVLASVTLFPLKTYSRAARGAALTNTHTHAQTTKTHTHNHIIL